MSLGWYHSCFLASLGQIKCFGANDNGQLGDRNVEYNIGDDPGEMGDALDRVSYGGVNYFVASLAPSGSGGAHTCAQDANGTGWDAQWKCWGYVYIQKVKC